jgi:hypothetical protein
MAIVDDVPTNISVVVLVLKIFIVVSLVESSFSLVDKLVDIEESELNVDSGNNVDVVELTTFPTDIDWLLDVVTSLFDTVLYVEILLDFDSVDVTIEADD